MAVTLRTNMGSLKLELFCEDCPKACENFLALCASGYDPSPFSLQMTGLVWSVSNTHTHTHRYYDGTKFHRCIKQFIIQGGDPTGTGKGGESCWGGYFKVCTPSSPCCVLSKQKEHNIPTLNHTTQRDTTPQDEVKQHLRHNTRGMVSMANRKGQQDTNGSQFFITFSKQPHLNDVNTVFAKVIHGWDTLDKLEKVPADAKGRPQKEVVLEGVTIHANPLADAARPAA